jgi:hypothetical protein
MRVTPTTAARIPIRTSTTGARVEKGSHSICIKRKTWSWVGYHGARSSQGGEQNGELHTVVVTSVITSQHVEAVGNKLTFGFWDCLMRFSRREVF